MAADPIIVGKTILSQTIVVANNAARSAAEAKYWADQAADKAPLTSPNFLGVPTAPTAAPGTNSTQIATTEYLDRLLAAPNGIATLDSSGLIPSSQLPSLALTEVYTVNSQAAMLALPAQPGDLAVRTDINETFILSASPASTLANWTQLLFAAPVTSVAGLVGDISGPDLMTALGAAPLASPTFTGTPAAPTPGSNINTTQIPTTAWVNTYFATLAGPTFTGTPIVPTAAADTNTGQAASTAYVLGQAGESNPVMNGTASAGASTRWSRQDHVHPTDTSRAPLNSPAFTGTPSMPTGTTAVTQSPGDDTTKLATTAFVTAAVTAIGAVTSVFGRTGAVIATTGDYSVSQITGAAPLNSPTFTGSPAAPTASGGTNTTQIATTAFVQAAVPASASQAEEEAANLTTVFSSPGRMKYHPGVAKAVGYFTSLGSTPPTITRSWRVASISRAAAGDYTVTWSDTYSAASDFQIAVMVQKAEQTAILAYEVSRTTNSVRIQVTRRSDGALTDPDNLQVECFGDLP